MLAGTRQFEQTWFQREGDLEQWVKCWKSGLLKPHKMGSSFVIAALSFNIRTYNNEKCHDFMMGKIINFLSQHPHHASLNFGKMVPIFFFLYIFFLS